MRGNYWSFFFCFTGNLYGYLSGKIPHLVFQSIMFKITFLKYLYVKRWKSHIAKVSLHIMKTNFSSVIISHKGCSWTDSCCQIFQIRFIYLLHHQQIGSSKEVSKCCGQSCCLFSFLFWSNVFKTCAKYLATFLACSRTG